MVRTMKHAGCSSTVQDGGKRRAVIDLQAGPLYSFNRSRLPVPLWRGISSSTRARQRARQE
jgi:hypothetical protein